MSACSSRSAWHSQNHQKASWCFR